LIFALPLALLLGTPAMPVEPAIRLDLSGEWNVRPESSAEYRKLPIPGIWDTGLKKTETYFYSKTVEMRPEHAGKHAFVRFGGVDYACDVFWDDTPLGSHEGYFQPFWFDLGEIGPKHTLTLKIINPWEQAQNYRGWHGDIPKPTLQGVDSIAWGHNFGGIWRPAEIIIGDAFIHRFSSCYLPEESLARLELEIISNPSALPLALGVSASLQPPSASGGKESLRAEETVTLKTPVTHVTLALPLPSPVLWSPDNPVRYTAAVSLVFEGRVVDSVRRSVGFKDLTIEGRRILLNGKPIFFRGLADYRFIRTFPIGASAGYPSGGDPKSYYPLRSEEISARSKQFISLLKKANCNIVRIPHFVMPEEFYEAADELGLCVYNDFPLHWKHDFGRMTPEWTLDQFESFLWDMSPHPSVVIIACSNEFKGIPEVTGIDLLKEMLPIARSWNPTTLLIANSGAEGLASWDWPEGASGEPLDDDIADYHRYVPSRQGDPRPLTSLADYIGSVFDKAAVRKAFKPFFFSEFAVKLPKERDDLFDAIDRLTRGEDPAPPRPELESEWTSLFGERVSFDELLASGQTTRSVLSAYWRQVQILECRRRWDIGAAGSTVWHAGGLLKDLDTPAPISYDLVKRAYAPVALYARTRPFGNAYQLSVWIISDQPLGQCTLGVTGQPTRRITINKPGIHLESYSLSEIGSFTLTLQKGPETLAYYLTHPMPPLRR